MTIQTPTIASPEVLFEVASTSSPELSFLTPYAAASDLHEDPKTSTRTIDDGEGARQNGLHVDIIGEVADKPLWRESEGLRTVNLTPTSPSCDAVAHMKTHVKPEATESDKRVASSPPIVLKSAPGTPSTEQGTLMENMSTQPSLEHDANTNISSNGSLGSEDDLDDPRALVISSLRTQISDLISQVNLLNSKLVQSYDRVSTLEETLDDNSERLHALEGERMNLEREKSVLEMERAKQEQMVKDGRLVERSAVAAELSRLMEESLASSSAKQSAEAKHKQMESELSDLSANLFSTANEMVATERQARSVAEESLASTRATVITLERHLEAVRLDLGREEREKEALRNARARTEVEMEELRKALRGINSSNVVSAGRADGGFGGVLRMMNSHVPYKNEYLGFLAHLRGLAGSTLNAPAITTLLTLPFLARLAVEDSEPTLRLDLAPSLNWLTRRSVLAAIHSNTLLIEQIHVATLFLEGSSSSSSYVGFGSASSLPTSPTQLTKVNCALCGKVVYMSPEAIQAEENLYQSTIVTQSPTTPTPTTSVQIASTTHSPQRTGSGSGWAASKFLKSVTLPSLGGVVSGANGSRSNSPTPRHSLDSTTANNSGPVTPTAAIVERPSSPPPPTSLQTVIHAFRIPLAGKSISPSMANLLPSASAVDPTQVSEMYGPPYPLCNTGWCLSRLKTTCELWGYVKADVVGRVWRDGEVERRRFGSGSGGSCNSDHQVGGTDRCLPIGGHDATSGSPTHTVAMTPPPLPPKNKMQNLWGMGRGVLDKAKAYGNVAPGVGGNTPSSLHTSATTGGASSFFGDVRRTVSGSGIITNSATPTESLADHASADGFVKGGDTMGTVKVPALPRRNASRLSAVFTGQVEVGDAGKGQGALPPMDFGALEAQNVVLALPNSEETAQQPKLTPALSVPVDDFVMASKPPPQELSLNTYAQSTKDGGAAEALGTTVSDHFSITAGKMKMDSTVADLEPPTPTPNSLGFGSAPPESPVKPALPLRTGHARNTSITSIISEDLGTKTPRLSSPLKRVPSGSKTPPRQTIVRPGSRPGTPTKAATATTGSWAGTPNNGVTGAGSRPSTPSKLATPAAAKPEATLTKTGPISPPPVPRRAAARNAGRSSVVPAPKEEKAGSANLAGVEETSGKEVDAANDGDNDVGVGKGGLDDKEIQESSGTPARIGGANFVRQAPPLDDTIAPNDSRQDVESDTPALDVDPPTPSSASDEDAARHDSVGVNRAPNSSPKSTPVATPGFGPPSPTSHPVLPLSPSLEGTPSAHESIKRPRQASVVSASSVYSPSVYTTNSGVNGLTGTGGDTNADAETRNEGHGGEVVKFYVGRETWEERAWLQLVQIRESMFWARLGGVRY